MQTSTETVVTTSIRVRAPSPPARPYTEQGVPPHSGEGGAELE